jgi:HEAT repeat protein
MRAAANRLKQGIPTIKGHSDKGEVQQLSMCLQALYPVSDLALAEEIAPLLSLPHGAWREIGHAVVPILAKTRDRRFVDPLIPLLSKDEKAQHGGGSLESVVCRALGVIGDPKAFDPMLKYLPRCGTHHYWSANRVAVFKGLIGCDPGRANKVLGDWLLKSKPHDVQQIGEVAKVLGEHPDPRSLPYLVYWINHDVPYVQEEVRKSIALCAGQNIQAAIEAFEVESHAKRSSLAGMIADLFGPKAVEPLMAAAKDRRPRIRQGAVWTLGCLGGAEALAVVKTALRDEHGGVRAAAAWAAGKLRDQSLTEAVISLLKDEDPNTKSVAAEQLGLLGEKKAVPMLAALLDDSAPQVRGHAALALGRLGALGYKARFEQLLKDDDPEVRTAAKYALKASESGAPR